MSTHRLNLHLVSDATGETLNSIVRATTVQFEHDRPRYGVGDALSLFEVVEKLADG